MWRNLEDICCVEKFLLISVLLQFSFVVKSVLSRFTRFCEEKNLTNNCACVEKRQVSGMPTPSPNLILLGNCNIWDL